MEFTETDLENLKAALLSGARKVQVGDRIVEYRSQSEIIAAIKMVEQYLAENQDANSNVISASYSRGER